jgi:hypothetical protein
VAAIAGDELAAPLIRVSAAFAGAEAALTELESARPGGQRFKDGLDRDVADRVAGQRPKATRIDRLLDGDRHRWVEALVACRSAVELVRAVGRDVDRRAIATEARKAADEAAATWKSAASAGWAGRADKAAAWQQQRAGEAALGDYLTALRLWEWATGAPGREPIAHRVVRIPDIEGLPPEPMAQGCWLALGLHLEPKTWLDIPQGVVWPDDEAEMLVMHALPEDGSRMVALKGVGVHGTNR